VFGFAGLVDGLRRPGSATDVDGFAGAQKIQVTVVALDTAPAGATAELHSVVTTTST